MNNHRLSPFSPWTIPQYKNPAPTPQSKSTETEAEKTNLNDLAKFSHFTQ